MTATDVLRTGTIFRRTLTTVSVEGDGRTIIGRAVPFDVVTEVSDGAGIYREVVRRGAFRKIARDPRRTALTFEHSGSLGDEIGRAVELDEREDALWITVRAHDSAIGEHGLAIIRDGFVTGLSISAILHPAGSKVVDGVVERVLFAQLPHVAATTDPAYADAQITAIRSGGDDVMPPGIAEVLAKTAALRARFDR